MREASQRTLSAAAEARRETAQRRARWDAWECLARFLTLALVVLALAFAEAYLAGIDKAETAARLDAVLVLAVVGMLDSARVSARKLRELRDS